MIEVDAVLLQAFRLGRDLEAHAHERFTDPANYDAICEYIATELFNLRQQLPESNNFNIESLILIPHPRHL